MLECRLTEYLSVSDTEAMLSAWRQSLRPKRVNATTEQRRSVWMDVRVAPDVEPISSDAAGSGRRPGSRSRIAAAFGLDLRRPLLAMEQGRGRPVKAATASLSDPFKEISMENGHGSTQASGFKAMSQNAESGGGSDNEKEGESSVAANLKSMGVDTNQMAVAAGERVGELQEMLESEIRARPMRALGWAIAIGVVVGFWAAK
jgi:hypothetical protein